MVVDNLNGMPCWKVVCTCAFGVCVISGNENTARAFDHYRRRNCSPQYTAKACRTTNAPHRTRGQTRLLKTKKAKKIITRSHRESHVARYTGYFCAVLFRRTERSLTKALPSNYNFCFEDIPKSPRQQTCKQEPRGTTVGRRQGIPKQR